MWANDLPSHAQQNADSCFNPIQDGGGADSAPP